MALAFNPGETDYQRTARALNTYAASGDQSSYDSAVKYAQSQGWGGMVPTTSPFATAAKPATSYAGNTTLRDAAKNAGLDLTYGNGQVGLSYQGGNPITFNAQGGLGGLTFDQGSNTNYITDNKQWDNIVNMLKGSTVQKPVTTAAKMPSYDFVGAFQDIMNEIENKYNIQPYKPQATSLEDTLAALKSVADPLQAIKMKDLAEKQLLAEKSLMAQMSSGGGGAYDSSEAVKMMARLKDQNLDATALLDAQYLSDLTNLATTVHQSELNRDAAGQGNYLNTVGQLANMFMSGAINLTQFMMDDSYRRAVLGQTESQNYLSNFGSFV